MQGDTSLPTVVAYSILKKNWVEPHPILNIAPIRQHPTITNITLLLPTNPTTHHHHAFLYLQNSGEGVGVPFIQRYNP